MGGQGDAANLAKGDLSTLLGRVGDPRERVLPRLVVLSRVTLGLFLGRVARWEGVVARGPLQRDVVEVWVHFKNGVT